MQQLIEKLKEPVYQELSDQEAADAVMQLMVTKTRLVPRKEILQIATVEGFYGHIVIDIENQSLPIDHRVALINIKGWIDNAANSSEYADLDSETAAKMIGDLLKYRRQGVPTNPTYITPAIAKKISDLKFYQVRWVDDVGIGEVGIGFVRNARKLMEAQSAK